MPTTVNIPVETTLRHSISSKDEEKRVQEEGDRYMKALIDRVEMEKEGYIFEVSAYYATVRKGEKTIIDHQFESKFCMTQAKREAMYAKHIQMAVKAVHDYKALGKKLLAPA